MKLSSSRLWVLFACALGLNTVGQWAFSRTALLDAEAQSARLVTHSLGQVLDHAHRMKDDLVMQEAIQGLARSPGVIYACVVDAKENVIAHTQPSLLGKPLKLKPSRFAHAAVWIHALPDKAAPWGSLVLSLSRRAARKRMIQQTGVIAAGTTFWMFLLLSVRSRWQQIRKQQREASEASDFRCQELVKDLSKLHQDFVRMDTHWAVWLDIALERISHPLVVLDPAQQLVTYNRAARDRLGIKTEGALRGRPWLDVPALAGCGQALQSSLERPGEKFAARSSPAGETIEFLSEVSNGEMITWISWI